MATIIDRLDPHVLTDRLRTVRAETERRAAPLTDADATPQSMPDASPAKWHLAHVSWFFETFILAPNVAGYRPFDEAFAYLFNSYYEAAGPRQARPTRGLMTRPGLDRIFAYRAHVDDALAEALPALDEEARALVELGLHHEQQHQELLLTDILHLFAQTRPNRFTIRTRLSRPQSRPRSTGTGTVAVSSRPATRGR